MTFLIVIQLVCFVEVFLPFLFIVHLFIVNYLLVMSKDIHVKAAELSKSATAGIEKFQQVPIKTYSHLFAHLEDINTFLVALF